VVVVPRDLGAFNGLGLSMVDYVTLRDVSNVITWLGVELV
jgi:hypothetical protein